MMTKRRVLCIFSLVAYLLLFCTIFAPMSQREMSVLVTVKQLDGSTKHNVNLSVYCYQWGDKEGLFQVVEGTGWNTGDRIAEIPSQYYRVNTGYFNDITLHPGVPYAVIQSATKTPNEGDPVQVVEPMQSRGEQLILYAPEGYIQTTPLQNNFTIAQQGENGILLDSMYLNMPFFEHTIRQSLSSRFAANEMRIYSYSEAESFLRQLPLIALLSGLLLAGVTLWAGTCLLTKRLSSPALALLNAALAGISLVLMLPVANAIDLPASLMPPSNILDIRHYCSEFSNIFAAMNSFGNQNLQNLSNRMLILSAVIVLSFVIAVIAIVLLERKFYTRKKTPIE